MSVQSRHDNKPLNAAATPDGQLLLESNSVYATENGVHRPDEFGIKCKPVGEKKLEASLFQPTDESGKAREKETSFFERIEELKSFYNERGHANVSEKENGDLAAFCNGVKRARRKPEKSRMRLDEERRCPRS